MAFSSARIQEAHQLLTELLGNRVSRIIQSITADSDSEQFAVIKIPEDTSTLSIDECLSLVARTSNRYADLASMSGVVSGMHKVAEARYKIKYKSSLKGTGKNMQEREANAVEAAADEMHELAIVEAVASMLDTALIAGRIASESARKILDKKQAEYQGQAREAAGYFMDKDFH